MKIIKRILLLFFFLLVLYMPETKACFGDKLGIGHLKGADNELSSHIVSLYIKEKTGIDSVVNEFATLDSAEKSMKNNETDIIIMIGAPGELDNKTLSEKHEESSFFTITEDSDTKVVIRVSKRRLEDIKFFTLNKVMDRIGKLISGADFKVLVSRIKSGEKFPKQAAREYLTEKDLI